MVGCTVLAALALSLAPAPAAASDDAAADEKFLKNAGVATDDADLLAFLRDRTLSDDDRGKLLALIRRLGADDFAEREQASADLIARGAPAVAPLREAVKNPDAEIADRAARCLEAIGRQSGRSAAVVRLLGKRRPDGAVEALARYAPFVDDDAVEDEVLASLLAVGLKDGKPDPVLTGMLQDPLAARRAAAAYVVGRARDADQRAAGAKLLKDAEPRVRLRAAQGLVGAKERAAVPVLIDLLAEAPPETAWQAEDILLRLAGDQPPTTDAAGPEGRKKQKAAWAKWWTDNGDKVDLARASQPPVYLGLTVVAEMHGNKVWECDRDGKVRRQWDNLQMPRDARVLPNGHLLVGEVTAERVTERDREGTVLWTYPVKDVAYVERLANGNTFVGTHQRAVELTPDLKEVFTYAPEAGFFIHSMNRKRDGHLVCLSMTGLVREVDREGKEVRTINVGMGKGNWSGVQGLPGDHYLAVEFNEGRVVEVDRDGKAVWETKVQGASYALRLPTGNTMVCSFGGQRVVEVNPKGEVVWEKKVATQPWRANFR